MFYEAISQLVNGKIVCCNINCGLFIVVLTHYRYADILLKEQNLVGIRSQNNSLLITIALLLCLVDYFFSSYTLLTSRVGLITVVSFNIKQPLVT